MSATVINVFYDVYLGFSHQSLTEVMKETIDRTHLEPGEVAVFINKAWSGCKILCPSGVLLYFRGYGPGAVTSDVIKRIPTVVSGPELRMTKSIGGNVDATLNTILRGKKPAAQRAKRQVSTAIQ